MLSTYTFTFITPKQSVKLIRQGAVICYPTEGVYGLGCNPFDLKSVKKILKIKKRNINKGLILIASNFNQIKSLINLQLIPKKNLNFALKSWKNKKKPITWLFPASNLTPTWIKGNSELIALRITSHTISKKICDYYNGPLVSTSVNLSNQYPITSIEEIQKTFKNKLKFIVKGKLGNLNKPTPIYNILNLKQIRQ